MKLNFKLNFLIIKKTNSLEESFYQTPLPTAETFVVGREFLSNSLANCRDHCRWKRVFIKLPCQLQRPLSLEESLYQTLLLTAETIVVGRESLLNSLANCRDHCRWK